MFEKLSDNLNLLMAEARISADELGRRIDIPASTIKKIRNRYSPNPTLSTLLPLAKFFCITLGQLVGDESLPTSRIKGSYQASVEVRQVPVLKWDEVLNWPGQLPAREYGTIASEYEYHQHAYALLVEEDDWENLSRETALLVDPTLKPMHRDFVIIHKKSLAIPSLKQILFDDEVMYLKSIIPGGSITVFSPDYQLLGIVVEYKKYLRK